jgi:glycosyltransferase involved in cell wall biosynthesis
MSMTRDGRQSLPQPLVERTAGSTRSAQAQRQPRATERPRGRVLVVAPQPFYTERGTPIAVRYVLEALSQLGFETDVLTFPLGSDIQISRTRVIRIADPLGTRSIPVGFSLRKLMFDSVMLASLGRQLRRRDYVCVHAVEEGALLALLARGRRQVPIIYDMASSLPEQLTQKPIFRIAPLQAVFDRIERYMLRRASVVVCSAGLAGHVRALAPAARLREWRFPSAGRDTTPTEVADLRRDLGLAQNAPVVLYTGNFAEYQGIGLLFDAIPKVLRQMPEASFVLVGAANQAEIDAAHGRLTESLRGRVRYIERQSRERIAAFIAMASVLVSPRSYGGNFPLKVFDYLAAGKPIVATDAPSHRVILDDSLAVMVEPSADGLADGIVRALKDRELAASLTAATRRFASQELSWPRFVALIDEIYALALTPATPEIAPSATRQR